MSKIIYVCVKNSRYNPLTKDTLEVLSGRLMPDNISPNQPKFISDGEIACGIRNLNDSILTMGCNICLGMILEPKADWWVPMKTPPGGSYAIFRSNNSYVEVLSDVVASRTVWYYIDDELFIAATSQRAIIFFLNSFMFNRAVIPWMLSTGMLGAENSWDSRIKCLSVIRRCY